MIRIIETRFQDYKLSLNKREKTLKIYVRYYGEKEFRKHIIASGLTREEIKSVQDDTDNDLLYWFRHDYNCTFSIWR